MHDVIILGAGHNGLVSAFYLARAGQRVLVVEAKPVVGGACVTEELIPGFRFSTCANVLWGLRPKIVREMRLAERGLTVDSRRFVRLFADGRYIFSDRTSVSKTAGADLAATQKQIAQFSAADADAFPRWQDFLARLVRIFGPHLLQSPPDRARLYAGCADAHDRQALDLVLNASVAELAGRFFETEVMRNVSAGADVGPREAGSALLLALNAAMGSYTETGEPVLNGFVRGGMGRIPELMREAAVEAGAEIRTGATVRRIRVEKGRAAGVELASGEVLRSRIVVSNADPKRTFLQLLEASDLEGGFLDRIRGLRTFAAAGLKLHCALSEAPEYRINPGLTGTQLRESTLILSPSAAYQEAAWQDALKGELAREPIIGGMMPSVYDPSLAPPGKFTWSAYVVWAPVRPKRGTWAERKEEMADLIFRQMDRHTTNFRRAVIDYVLLTPEDFEKQKLLTDGNIHHVDATASQLLWRRPLEELANYRTPIASLYLCGSGTHPWGEISGAPGHNAAQVILADSGVCSTSPPPPRADPPRRR